MAFTADGSGIVFARGGSGAAPIRDMQNTGGWSGVVFAGTEGTVYGDVVLRDVLTIPAGYTLCIPQGASLDISAAGAVNEGVVNQYGSLTGRFDGDGEVHDFSPTPEPEPELPAEPAEEEEEPSFTPTEQVSDGAHDYSMGTMLYIDGKRAKGLTEYEGETYYFGQSGWMQTGWARLEDGWRHFGEDGRMQAGWMRDGSVWYYLDPETGVMADGGLRTIGKSTYYFHGWGGMASDWWYEDENGDWYYFGGSGAMKAASWVEWQGGWYYLTESGKMAVSTDVGGYYVGADGRWAESF